MNREEVYAQIDLERNYQDTLGGDRVDGHKHSVGEELVVLQVYLQKALEAWVKSPGDKDAIVIVSKIAAVAVRCMENYNDD